MNTLKSIFENDEIRVIPLYTRDGFDREETIIMPHKMKLPRGIIGATESIESAAIRVARDGIDQPNLTSVARLAPLQLDENSIHAYVLEASTGQRTNLRRGFAARAFQLDFLLKDASEYPDKYDEYDIHFLQNYSDKAFRIHPDQSAGR